MHTTFTPEICRRKGIKLQLKKNGKMKKTLIIFGICNHRFNKTLKQHTRNTKHQTS